MLEFINGIISSARVTSSVKNKLRAAMIARVMVKDNAWINLWHFRWSFFGRQWPEVHVGTRMNFLLFSYYLLN